MALLFINERTCFASPRAAASCSLLPDTLASARQRTSPLPRANIIWGFIISDVFLRRQSTVGSDHLSRGVCAPTQIVFRVAGA